jgi:IS30 family transposase
MGARRTPKQKAIAAIAMSEVEGVTSLEIAKRLNVPASTIRDILAGNSPRWAALRQDDAYIEYADTVKRELQLAYSEIAKASLEQAERQLPAASYAQALMGAAIATDKALRLNGEAVPGLQINTRSEIETLDDLAEKLSRSLLTNKE